MWVVRRANVHTPQWLVISLFSAERKKKLALVPSLRKMWNELIKCWRQSLLQHLLHLEAEAEKITWDYTLLSFNFHKRLKQEKSMWHFSTYSNEQKTVFPPLCDSLINFNTPAQMSGYRHQISDSALSFSFLCFHCVEPESDPAQRGTELFNIRYEHAGWKVILLDRWAERH